MPHPPNTSMTTPIPVRHHWRTNHQPIICSVHSSKRKRWISFLGLLTLEPARKAHPLASLSTSVIGCLGIGGVTEAEGKLLSFQEPPFLPRLGRTDGKDG
ncbi:hypothetical protein AMELA_G00173250 [Ameiurus melas]|uniref:Uncharacterized protein n=1 Tax=Ameiurus melas TaxID=219545 RepID=A0A7J6AF12_AMEME|nr:hypothetical protein AMELA_G00173250 [Ameiurus melas]